MAKWSKKNQHLAVFLVSTCILYGIILCILILNGMFFIHFQYDLDAGPAAAALTVGLTTSVSFISGPFLTIIYNWLKPLNTLVIGCACMGMGTIAAAFMPRIIYIQIIFGGMCGIGSGLINIAVFSLVGQAFSSRRSLANSIITSSGPLLTFACSPLLHMAIESFSWRWAMALEGAIILNGVPLAMVATRSFQQSIAIKLMEKKNIKLGEKINSDITIESCSLEDNKVNVNQQPNTEMPCCSKKRSLSVASSTSSRQSVNEEKPTSSSQIESHITKNTIKASIIALFEVSLLADVLFISYCISVSFGVVARISVSYYLVRYAQDIKIDDSLTAYMISISQITNVATCLLVGIFTSFKKASVGLETEDSSPRSICSRIHRSHVLAFIMVYAGCIMLIPVLVENQIGFILYSVMIGIATGGIGALPITVLADFFGTKTLPTTIGLRSLFTGVMSLVAPSVIGYFVQMFGNFRPAQVFMSISCILSAFLILCVYVGFLKRENRNIMK